MAGSTFWPVPSTRRVFWVAYIGTNAFLKPHPSNSLGAFLQHHCSGYGKVFKSHLFLSPTIVSCDQELNYFILQNEGKLFECSYPKPIHGILGKSSMLLAVADTHKRLRTVAVSLVTITKSKPEFLSDIEATTISILHSWKDKSQVIFCEEARKFTFNVIVKQVLGLTPDEPQTTRILEDFLTFMRALISLPLYIPGTPYARAVKRKEEDKHAAETSTNSSSSKRSDFLEILMDVDTLSEDEKVSFILDSLLGGYEATSLLISMAVYFLAQSPSALQQLKVKNNNIRRGKQKEEYLNWEDYKKMEFTQNVIKTKLSDAETFGGGGDGGCGGGVGGGSGNMVVVVEVVVDVEVLEEEVVVVVVVEVEVEVEEVVVVEVVAEDEEEKDVEVEGLDAVLDLNLGSLKLQFFSTTLYRISGN
ncbi:hypothetical protein L3X38_018616 [Prunus dulcis]|uniref:Cytochrome P450 superfamily protein n=1 Tax=Prunus dulcis TaxID=3755 RepID=A0AAD4W9K7_PRUDU|nr:hypothetical protein L3X38_018616 [Prunus dulcis]